MLALGLVAGLGAGCNSTPEGKPDDEATRTTVTVTYEVVVGNGTKTQTCVQDQNGRRCTPGVGLP